VVHVKAPRGWASEAAGGGEIVCIYVYSYITVSLNELLLQLPSGSWRGRAWGQKWGAWGPEVYTCRHNGDKERVTCTVSDEIMIRKSSDHDRSDRDALDKLETEICSANIALRNGKGHVRVSYRTVEDIRVCAVAI
jgi:hypothetical protein